MMLVLLLGSYYLSRMSASISASSSVSVFRSSLDNSEKDRSNSYLDISVVDVSLSKPFFFISISNLFLPKIACNC